MYFRHNPDDGPLLPSQSIPKRTGFYHKNPRQQDIRRKRLVI